MTNASLITTFENTIQSFLGEKLNESNGLVVKAYDVTVVAQTLKDPSTENRVLQSTSGSSYLFVDTSLTAKGSPPALAARFPFQAYVHDVATKNDDELFKAIYASVLKHLEETNETESVGMSSINGSKIKNVAIGSTIAGAAVLVSAIFTLFIMHRRRVNDRLADNVVPPPAAYAVTERPQEELSSIDDSLLSATQIPAYPENIPHYNPDQTSRSFEDAKNDDDNSSHQSALKRVSFVAVDAPSQNKMALAISDEENMLLKVEEQIEEQSCHSDPSLSLYEKSMPGEGTSKESQPRPFKPSPSLKLFNFSCFADNTFEEKPRLSAKEILQNQYRSSTPKTTNRIKPNHNVYEVRAPPGGLGLVIDSNEEGPFVYEVKATSPLHGQIEQGDMILCIDGWQCTGQNSRSVANWIRKKPKDDEQVLVLQGSKHDDAIDEKSV